MAKKINKLTARTLKSGEIRIYEGRKVADKAAKKAFFRENLQNVDRSKLSKEDALLFSRVKGGVSRSQGSDKFRVKGQFVGEGYKRAAKKIGIDLDKLIDASGEKNLGALFAKNEGLKESLDSLLSGVGLAMWHSPQKAMDIVNDYRGESISINGKQVTKSQAKSLIRKTETAIFRKFDTVDQAVKLNFVGSKQMNIRLPDIDDLDEYESEADFAEDNSEFYTIFVSGGKKTK